MISAAAVRINTVIARCVEPRRVMTVSDWADAERTLSNKESPEPGKWRTARNPPLREPQDCFSVRSPVQEVVCKFPIQYGKTAIAQNVLGYKMDRAPAPTMVALPSEVSRDKWIAQKLQPMIDETPAVRRALTSVASRDSANTRNFKDFVGGQLYLEHAGSTTRLKSTTVKNLIVDEYSEFATNTPTGDDPGDMLDGRTSAYPTTYQRLYISTPGIKGICRIEEKWEQSDQRTYHVPCPHPNCGFMQPLVWAGLQWSPDGRSCWYLCSECQKPIQEHHKTRMLESGRWVPANPESKIRGYTINGLYYPIGLGPRWLTLVGLWLKAQGNPAKLKTFINDRLAESWEDPAMRAVKHNVIGDRAEPYKLRFAPRGVLAVTVGTDTQDNRLAVQFIGWGRGLACWVLDYVELPGDPADEAVWNALVELVNKPIQSGYGGELRVEATAIDAGGHRTEAVKNFVRSRRIRRPLCIFGAKPNNAPVLSKGKLEDVTWKGKTDKRGVMIHHVGTVAIKHLLYSRLSTDADKTEVDQRLVHLSDELHENEFTDYFGGLVAEAFNPAKNRFEPRRGAPRNEPLDTWVYGYAGTHHPELRLHRYTRADWDRLEARLTVHAITDASADTEVPRGPQLSQSKAALPKPKARRPTPAPDGDFYL